MSGGVEGQSEIAIGFGVGGIHAESGARFGERVFGVVVAVKEIRKLAVGLGEIGDEARGFGELVQSFVEEVFTAQDGSEDKVLEASVCVIAGVVAKQGAEFVFGGGKVTVANQSGDLRGRGGASDGRRLPGVSRTRLLSRDMAKRLPRCGLSRRG